MNSKYLLAVLIVLVSYKPCFAVEQSVSVSTVIFAQQDAGTISIKAQKQRYDVMYDQGNQRFNPVSISFKVESTEVVTTPYRIVLKDSFHKCNNDEINVSVLVDGADVVKNDGVDYNRFGNDDGVKRWSNHVLEGVFDDVLQTNTKQGCTGHFSLSAEVII